MIDGRMDLSAQAGPAPAGPRPLQPGQARGSLLSAGEFAALTGAGFDPVGYVMGAAVVRLRPPTRKGRPPALLTAHTARPGGTSDTPSNRRSADPPDCQASPHAAEDPMSSSAASPLP